VHFGRAAVIVDPKRHDLSGDRKFAYILIATKRV